MLPFVLGQRRQELALEPVGEAAEASKRLAAGRGHPNELAAAVEFDWETARKSIESVRPGMQIFRLSAKTGEGMESYLEFLTSRLNEHRSVART